MDQLLNDFSPGLFIMQTVILVILIFLMRQFAWKPILNSLNEREDEIKTAIESAQKAKEEMAKLTADNEKLLAEARLERDKIITAAKTASDNMINEAKTLASVEADKMVAAAKQAIETEKKAALAEVRNQVAELSVEIAEKLLRKELSSKDANKQLVDDLIKDVKFN